MAGLKYWVWLNECRGLTNRSRALLLDHFGSPEDVYYADEAEYALVEGLSKKQIELLADKSADGADKILGDCQRLGLRILTMQDADYPARLLLDAARKTTHEWCANSLALCQKLDRRMKSEKGIDREGELKLLLVRLGAQRR